MNGCRPARGRSCPRRHPRRPRRRGRPRRPRRRGRRPRSRPTRSATRAQVLSAGRSSTLRRPSQGSPLFFSLSTMFASATTASPQITSGRTQIGTRRCRAIWWQQEYGYGHSRLAPDIYLAQLGLARLYPNSERQRAVVSYVRFRSKSGGKGPKLYRRRVECMRIRRVLKRVTRLSTCDETVYACVDEAWKARVC